VQGKRLGRSSTPLSAAKLQSVKGISVREGASVPLLQCVDAPLLASPGPTNPLRRDLTFASESSANQGHLQRWEWLQHSVDFLDNGSRCQLVSRNGHVFRGWPTLANEIAASLQNRSVVLDGEICCLNADGRSDFYRLMFRRERQPFFYAFDVLAVDGEDLTVRPLLDRKRQLRAIVPRASSRLLYLDGIRKRGNDLFQVACERDLEGIVAKWSQGTYKCEGRGTSWLKIKNAAYTQMDGRREVFEQRVAGTRRERATAAPKIRLA
jgi:bifunctional non-homologous end joining protein LigD